MTTPITCCNSRRTCSGLPVRPVLLRALPLLLLLSPSARAMTYDVAVDGDGFGLAEAMDLAEAEDTVNLQDGTYEQALENVRDGESGNPITVVGGPGAIIKAQNSAGHSVFVGHSFIELKGFTVEGQIGTEVTEDSYVLNCIYVQGPGSDSSTFLDGFVMEEMAVQNCGGECVRLKDGVTNAKIFSNTITNCGIHDYMFESGDMNGQGVCIGTSSDEWPDGEEDVCTNNLVAGNVIDTSANECVDVKEGAYGNVIEDNMCYNQLDINAGCYNSRGNDNIFRNAGSDCLGAGVRLGGWEVDGFQYGVGNSVYDNDFNDVGFGALKIMVDGQGTICGNTCAGDDCQLIGDYLDDTIDTWDHACYEDDEVTSTSSYYDDDRKTYYSGYDDVTSTSSYNDDDSKTYISAYDDVTSTVSEDNEATTMTVSGDDGVTSTSSYYDNDSKIYSSGYDDVTSTVGGYDEVTSTSSYYDDDSKTYIRGYDDVTSTVDEDDELTTVTVSEDDEVTSTSSYYEEATSTVSEGDNDSGDDDSSDGDSDCDSCDGESSDDDVLGQGYGFAGAMASQ